MTYDPRYQIPGDIVIRNTYSTVSQTASFALTPTVTSEISDTVVFSSFPTHRFPCPFFTFTLPLPSLQTAIGSVHPTSPLQRYLSIYITLASGPVNRYDGIIWAALQFVMRSISMKFVFLSFCALSLCIFILLSFSFSLQCCERAFRVVLTVSALLVLA